MQNSSGLQKSNKHAPTQGALSAIVSPLLTWYDEHARILPWRENPTPYHVWVSEIMLQQTRVEAVKPYFERFICTLPTLESLANAPEKQLLKLWEGLGYYNRVRNLQKAAQMIMNQFHGEFPSSYEDILSLPGIGEYTAGAISSISFGKPIPAVDGNVLRVITRITESRENISKQKVKNDIANALKKIYPMRRCGDFTQSLMELGATVCLPNGAPKCESCPLSQLCAGHQSGTAAELPIKPKKKPRKEESRTVFLVLCEDKIAIHQRKSQGLLAGLWEFPNSDQALTEAEACELLKSWNIDVAGISPSIRAKHIFTHLEWHMTSYVVRCNNLSHDFMWVTKQTLEKEISLPSAFRPFLAVF